MSIDQSNLSSSAYGYGLVVATTQASINATMKAFLRAQTEPEVVICYVYENGVPTAIDFATLQQRAHGSDPFSIPGTADPATSPDIQNLLAARFMVGIKARIGLPPGYAPSAIPDIVGLSGGAASVSYNLMCSEFIVTQLTPSGYGAATWMNKAQPPGDAWIFNSKVDLQMSPTSNIATLPPAVQAQLQNLGGSGFGVQQLLFDLDNAGLESVPTIEGVAPGSTLYLVLQQYFLGAYMATLKKNGQPVLGCVITTTTPASPLDLTALNFQVNPLLDSNGGPIPNPTKDQLGLTTLSYLCAIDGATLPNPAPFSWNWVESQDQINYDGAMAVNRSDFARYLWTAVQGGVSNNCLAPHVKVTLKPLGVDFFPKLNQGTVPAPDYPATGTTLLTLSQTATSSDQAGYNGDVGKLTLTSTFKLAVTCSGNQIVFAQHLVVYMYIQSLATGTGGNIVDRTITDTYSISVDDTGRIVGALAKSDPQDNSQTIDVGGFVNWFVDINSTIDGITKYARAVAALHLADIPLSTIQGFVFPGGNSFSFADGGFSEFQDLVAHITYVRIPPDHPSHKAAAMKIVFESELMKNQKHAQVMAPDARFEVLQTQQGSSLFFSLGTDGVFYLTQETNGAKTGWTRQDLSSPLARQFGGGAITTRAFDVSQDPQTGAIDLALAVTAGGADHLFLSRGNSNADTSWARGVTWTPAPYDDAAHPMPVLQVADIEILQVSGAEYFVVDILQKPGDPLQQILRYYITPGSGQQWNPHGLAAAFSAGSMTTCLGQRYPSDVAGTYTFGAIGSTTQLIYTPLWNDFDKHVAPSPVVLTPPPQASAVSASLLPDGTTNLFVAGDQTLWLFTPGSLGKGGTASAIVNNPVIAGVQQLHAVASAGATEVWGVNQQGTLFYVRCQAGSEANPSAWSLPLPILENVQRIAPFLNNASNTAVLFAHIGEQDLIQLTKDPVTSAWQQRAILLPATDLNDMVEYQSFTTHIRVADDNNLPQPNVPLSITASSPVSVYANDVYHTLSPDVPILLAADASGVLTVIQQTHTVAAICLKVTPQPVKSPGSNDAPPPAPTPINPMAKLTAKLAKVQSGDDLGNAQVPNADGSQSPLLPAGTTDDQKTATAQALQQFVKMNHTLPQDGTVQPKTASLRRARTQLGNPVVWGVSFAPEGWRYHEGDAAIAHFALAPDPQGALRLQGQSAIAIGWGDFVAWIKSVWDDVVHFFVQAADDVYNFFVQVGDEIYHLIIDCIHAVVQAVEFVFNKIKVFFEDLVKWLGFLFQWSDILRTHKVMKNILKTYAVRATVDIALMKANIGTSFTTARGVLEKWADLPPGSGTIGGDTKSSTSVPGQDSPQSNWGVHHTKSNISVANVTYTPPAPAPPSIFDDFKAAIDQEGKAFKKAFEQLKSDVIDHITTLSAAQVANKVVAILGEFLLNTAETLLDLAIDVLATMVEGIIDLIDAPINIPIISPLYSLITDGSQLSVLDLICLVVAIPVTLIYKIVVEKTPFPDDTRSQALIDAPDFAAVQNLFAPAARGGSDAGVIAADDIPDDAMAIAAFSLNIGAAVAMPLLIIVNVMKRAMDEAAPPSTPLNAAAAGLYVVYVAPNITSCLQSQGEWYNVMNDAVTAVSVLKTAVDNVNPIATRAVWRDLVSPWLEVAINAAWLFPAFGSIAGSTDASTVVGLASNLAFDFGGILTPSTNKLYYPELDPVDAEAAADFAFGAAQFLSAVYGVLCIVEGGLKLAKKSVDPLPRPAVAAGNSPNRA